MLDWESIYTNQYWPKAFLVLCVDRSSLYTLQKDNCNGQFNCFHLILTYGKITHIGKDQIQIKGLYVWKDTYNRCTKLHRAMAQNKIGFKPNKIYLRTIKRFIKVFTALFVFHVLPQLKRFVWGQQEVKPDVIKWLVALKRWHSVTKFARINNSRKSS